MSVLKCLMIPPPDPGHVKKCSNICPLLSFGAKRLVKTTSILKGKSIEKFHESSNIVRQARIRDEYDN
jgi:hypothetical protein